MVETIKFTLTLKPCLMCRQLKGGLSKQQFSRVMSEMATEVGGLCTTCLVEYHSNPTAAYVLYDGLSLEVKR